MANVQKILLTLIIIGVGFLATQKWWAPRLAESVVERESRTWIDDYFSKEGNEVYYASFQSSQGVVSVTSKKVPGGDAETFERVGDFQKEKTAGGYREFAEYRDKNATYTYSILKDAGGVSTLLIASTTVH